MKKKVIYIIVICLASACWVHAQSDSDLFRDARLLIFDKKWNDALSRLNQIITKYPDSRFYNESIFHRAKCLAETGKYQEAIKDYEKYIDIVKKGQLVEEANVQLIDISFNLISSGDRHYPDKIIKYLKSENRVLRYYAAFKLSYVKDRKIANRGIPVLLEILSNEKDVELKDRAKLALLRINPEYIKELHPETDDLQSKFINITVEDRSTGKLRMHISIPLSLADIALRALSEDHKMYIKDKGFDSTKLLEELIRTKEIMTVESEEVTIKIWIE